MGRIRYGLHQRNPDHAPDRVKSIYSVSSSVCKPNKIKHFSPCASFEDTSETNFFGWGVESWIRLAGGKELIFGHYEEDNGNAEFIHIKYNACIREYRAYDFEDAETDEGSEPVFSSWVDVATYVDKNLL